VPRPMPPLTVSGTSPASGNITLTMPAQGVPVTVQQISVQTGGTTGTAAVFVNGQFFCGTSQASEDSADGLPYLPVDSGDTVTVQFEAVGVGVSVQATFWGEQ
jgi:hypothetical protein